MEKIRLDLCMVEKNIASSREKARGEIMAGNVLVNGKPAQKAGEMVAREDEIVLRKPSCPFVSRGGKKLEKAMQVFSIDLKEQICADIGASTGGFTDCMLQHGAKKVYAIDVGYGQLDWKLRNDPRVIVMERQNARLLEKKQFPDLPKFASVDVSFISLKLIFPVLQMLGVCQVMTLIKPQFEAGKELVGKKGVVRDAKVHEMVIGQVLSFANTCGFYAKGLNYSPIKGPNGNIEYLAYYENQPEQADLSVSQVVQAAHAALNAGKSK